MCAWMPHKNCGNNEWMYVRMYMCLSVCMYVCRPMYVCMCVYLLCVCECMYVHGDSIKSKPNCLCHIYLMLDHITLKLSRYLENSTNNKDTSVWTDCCVPWRISASLLWCPLRLRRLVVHIILVFIDPDFISPTYPTNVAWDSLHHGLVSGRLALALRSTLYIRQDSNHGLFGGHNVGGMKSGVFLLSISTVSLALWAVALSCWKIKQPSRAIFLITGKRTDVVPAQHRGNSADDFKSRINEDQNNVNDQASKLRLWITWLFQFLRSCVQAEGGHFEHLP